ncbi:MAG: glycosyltransferase [Luteitalea sp.]|nr:glycosyltransferase [Luteitalea sp.]
MRVWFMTHRLPYAPNRGDRIRAYHILQWLHRRAEVDLLSLVHDTAEEQAAAQMSRRAASVHTAMVPRWRNRLCGLAALPTGRPLTLSLLDAPALEATLRSLRRERRPDVVLAYCSSMAAHAMNPVLDGVRYVLDMVDVDSAKWQSLAERGRWHQRPIYAREARTLRTFERRAMRAAHSTIGINERESQALREIDPEATVVTIGNGVAFDSFTAPSIRLETASVVFCGVMDYAPNEAAALRLIQNIWPLVRLQRPDATLWLVGTGPSERMRAAARGEASIHITGSVPDVRPYLWRSAVAAAPLLTARGVQNKVLEALAAGLPVVVSPVVAEGLPPCVEPGVAVAGSDSEFAQAVCRLLALLPSERRQMAAAADLKPLTWERQLEPLWGLLTAAAEEGGRRRSA